MSYISELSVPINDGYNFSLILKSKKLSISIAKFKKIFRPINKYIVNDSELKKYNDENFNSLKSMYMKVPNITSYENLIPEKGNLFDIVTNIYFFQKGNIDYPHGWEFLKLN